MRRTMSGPIRVLHVDDDAEFRERTASGLRAADRTFVVETTDDPEAAVIALEDDGYDCVVSGYDLPDMDGLDFFAAVRGVDADVPFVLVTASGSENVASEAISAGVDEYVRKREVERVDVLANRIGTVVDRARTDLALRESERRYRTLVEQSTEGIYIRQGDHIVFANDRLCEMTGYDRDELAARDVWSFIAEEDRERIRSAAAELTEDGDPIVFRGHIVAKDGNKRLCVNTAQYIEYDGDLAVLGSARDITDQARTETELREMLDRMTDAFFALDTEWQFSYLNCHAEKLLGEQRESLVGESVWDAFAPAKGTTFERQYRHAVETGLSVYFRDVTDEADRVNEAQTRQATLSLLIQAVRTTDRPVERMEGLLGVVSDAIGLRYGAHVSLADGFAIEASVAPDGDGIPNGIAAVLATAAERTLADGETRVDAADDGGLVTTFVGAPVVAADQSVVCFADDRVREAPVSQWDRTLVDLVATWVGQRGAERVRG